MNRMKAVTVAILAAIGTASVGTLVSAQAPDDAAFAGNLWGELAALRLVGPEAVGAVPYPRQGAAHGALLVSLQSVVTVDGVTGVVIVKRSYADGIGRDDIIANPNGDVANVTVMFKREGYDPANADWFWAMYMPDGTLGQMEGMTVAGQVPFCSGCHVEAPGGDYIFLHDALATGR